MVLSIGNKKVVASTFIGAGLLMILPGIGDTIINFPLAEVISTRFGTSFLFSLVLTYTVIPIALIWIGSLIYPSYQINRILHTHKHTIKIIIQESIQKIRNDRKLQLTVITIILVVYNLYKIHNGGV